MHTKSLGHRHVTLGNVSPDLLVGGDEPRQQGEDIVESIAGYDHDTAAERALAGDGRKGRRRGGVGDDDVAWAYSYALVGDGHLDAPRGRREARAYG